MVPVVRIELPVRRCLERHEDVLTIDERRLVVDEEIAVLRRGLRIDEWIELGLCDEALERLRRDGRGTRVLGVLSPLGPVRAVSERQRLDDDKTEDGRRDEKGALDVDQAP